MNCLELFSGTGSVRKVCEELGWNSVSVDMILPADHQVNILDFDYKQYPKDYFSVIWASPPCVSYSALKNCWIGQKLKDGTIFTKEQRDKDMDDGDKLVAKSLEIIDYFKPDLWCMENPATGRLKSRDVVKGLPFYDVDYCMYCDWGYKKPTRIWTNKKDWTALRCNKNCGNMIEIPTDALRKHKVNVGELHSTETIKENGKNWIVGNHHKGTLGGSHGKHTQKFIGSGTDRLDRYRVPPNLILSLFLD